MPAELIEVTTMKPEQQQDEIRKSEARFRTLFENAVDAIFIADAEGVFTDVNTSGCRLLGYEREEFIGKAIVDVLEPEETKRFLDSWDVLLEGKTHFEEWRMIRKNGSSVAVEVSAKMLPDGCLQAFVRDITGRKRMEEAGKRQIRYAALRAEVQTAFAGGGNSLESILQSNMESIVRHLDAAIARVWLLDEEKNILELQASDGIYTHVDDKYSRVEVGQYQIGKIAAEKKFSYSNAILEVEQIDKEWVMSEKLISYAGFPLIVNDKVVGVVAAVSRYALTEDTLEAFETIAALIAQGVVRKQAEDSLRAEQQLLESIVDNSTALIHVKDLNNRLLLVNKSFAALLHLAPEQMLGKTHYEMWELSPVAVDKTDVDTYQAFDAEVLDAGIPLQKEISISLVGGEKRYFLVTKSLLCDDDGKTHSICTVATEITEIRRAEKELHRLQTELAHAARVLTVGALTTSIAHEVNQPLAGVVTNGNACLRWLAKDPPDLEEARTAVNRIIRDGIRAGEVITRARALLKKSPPDKLPLDINEIVTETMTLAQHEIQKNKILLQTRFAAELPLVSGDKIQLQQVLLNLIMNGIDAVKAATSGEARLSVETGKDEKGNIIVAVKDSGIGLDAGKSDKIFESFYTTKKEGIGMGLAISRSIIEAHGGRLRATPNKEGGATFQFTLPVKTYEE